MKKARYVVQEHKQENGVHWDLMLEDNGVLITFQMAHPPSLMPEKCSIQKIFDHPLRFLHYEGPVQNHTGCVKIADSGTYEARSFTDTEIQICFAGAILQNSYHMVEENHNLWSMIRITS